ncbi:MAG: hypothetical protein Q9217_000436 [Psora testacea]
MPRATRIFFFTLLLFILVIYSFFHFRDSDKQVPHFQPHAAQPKQDPSLDFKPVPEVLNDVHNSTLGFQKVFVINLPERSDKLDAFTLAASLTGFSAEVLEGVKGADVANKTLPSLEGLPKEESTRDNVVGCWRAHMNFARTMISERLQSALVIEDDADWDIHLKSQLSLFAQGTQYITGTPSNKRPFSPYGDDWDLLWLGHCSSQFKSGDQRRFVVENDETVVSPERRINFSDEVPDMAAEGFDNTTRVLYEASYGICTYAYALSNRGAKRLLRGQSISKAFLPIDLGMGQMCREDPSFKCIGVFPQIVDSHKGAGSASKDSDIDTSSEKGGEIREKGYTPNIVYSTKLNLDRLLAGDKVDPSWRQWPDEPTLEGPARTRTINRLP